MHTYKPLSTGEITSPSDLWSVIPSYEPDSKQKSQNATMSHNNKQMPRLRDQRNIYKLFMLSVLVK